MIGVIPAAGEGKRLGLGVKALVKIGNKHLIEYPLQNLIDIGIKAAIIIQHNSAISTELGGRYKSLKLLYVNQRERKGIAHALSLAEPLIQKNEYMFIILGDIVYQGDDLVEMRRLFEWNRQSLYCLYGMQKVKDKNEIKKSYGFKMYGPTRPTEIIEKPKNIDELIPYVGLGIYVATPKIFDYIRKTPVSRLRNEVEITHTLNLMARDYRVAGVPLQGYYVNINTREDLLRV